MPSNVNEPTRKTRPDLATLFGLIVGVGSIIGGLILEGGKIADIAKPTAALIVLGGTLGAVLVTTPLSVFLESARALFDVLLDRPYPLAGLADTILHFAERARRIGLAALETEADLLTDPFLRKALNLAIDGTDIREIREIMRLEIDVAEIRSESRAKVWESAAGYAPTIGIIGAVLGLIQVMKHLDKVDEVGHGIAVAFVATVYGVASANLLFLPAASKLKERDQSVRDAHEMILEGVIAIAEGMNPKLIRKKLEPFIPSENASGARSATRHPAEAPSAAA